MLDFANHTKGQFISKTKDPSYEGEEYNWTKIPFSYTLKQSHQDYHEQQLIESRFHV